MRRMAVYWCRSFRGRHLDKIIENSCSRPLASPVYCTCAGGDQVAYPPEPFLSPLNPMSTEIAGQPTPAQENPQASPTLAAMAAAPLLETTEMAALAARFVNSTARHVFLTGKAGTGKTTFLHQLARSTHKRFVILAPTGIAALNAKGVTIHSQFLLPFGSFI